MITAAEIRTAWIRMKASGAAPVIAMLALCLLVDAAVYAVHGWPF